MALLPADGTLSYSVGGQTVTFTSLYRTSITGKIVPDPASRATRYVEYALMVEGFLQDDNGTDTTMDTYRKILTQPAGMLEYQNKGFGDFMINTPGGTRDVKYGPWPTELYFQPLGASQGCRLGWKCVICIPECLNGIGSDFLAFTFDIVWGIDQDGFTTVTYSGEAEIAINRAAQNSRAITDSADEHREKVAAAFPVLPAMRRDEQTWNLSNDRRILRFTIKDVEQPMPLPVDATQIKATEEVVADNTSGACSFTSFTVTLRGDITLKRGADKKQMLAHIVAILAVRMEPFVLKGFLVLARGLTLGDDIFGRSGSFAATFQVIADLGLNQAVEASSNNQFIQTLQVMALAAELWTPIAGATYPAWQKSLQDSSTHPRGFLRARHRKQDDAIIDICANGNYRISGGKASPNRRSLPPAVPRFGGKPRPSNSWLEYENSLEYREGGSTIQHTPVDNVREKTPRRQSIDAIGPGLEAGFVEPASKKVQQTRDPEREIILRGRSKRAWYQSPPPKLLQIGGQPVKEKSRVITQDVVEVVGGIPIWEMRWRLKYVIDDAPQGNIDAATDAIKLRQGGSRYTR